MTRTPEQRTEGVRRLLAAAGRVYERRQRLLPALVESTHLSAAGVELGFESLERTASEGDLRSLVAGSGDASHVHVVLSANVFVAPLRALAIACAAAPRVTVRPSARDPVLMRALAEEMAEPRDEAIGIVDERDPGASAADVIHVYGRDATIEAVRARVRPGVRVRGHGDGMGVALVTRTASLDRAAEQLALDVVAFDQRGCLSARVVLVEGEEARAEAFGETLHAVLAGWDARVPRGELWPEERAQAAHWSETVAFAGRVWRGETHVVGVARAASAVLVPPPGRHVHLAPVADLAAASALLAPLARFVVTVGSDDPARAALLAPLHARVTRLGSMQRPPLDGPVDRRSR